MLNRFFISCLFVFIAGCATTPDFDTTMVNKSLVPSSVLADTKNSLGKSVIWGGTILSIHNLKDHTDIEILAYPLSSSHRPLIDKKPLGRAIIRHSGYLETVNYPQGRQLSVLGKVAGTQKSKIGESSYDYPIIQAEKLHLWPAYSEKSKTSFHLGIGIGL